MPRTFINKNNPVDIVEVISPKNSGIVEFKNLKTGGINKMTSDVFKENYYENNSDGNNDVDKLNVLEIPKRDVFLFEYTDEGVLTIKKDGEIIQTFNIRGPQGEEGKVYPVVKDGELYFTNKDGEPITQRENIKGEEGATYEPVYDEINGKLSFRNSKTGVFLSGNYNIKGKDGNDGKTFSPRITDDGKYLYFIDENGKKISGEYLIKGKNAFEEWQATRDQNSDRSWEAYLQSFKGAPGNGGKSAFELWKEVHGEYTNPEIEDFFTYLKGKDGKDAYEVWKDMGFNGEKKEFFEWIASLVKAVPGKDGNTYYPHFDGYDLYFTEDKEGKGTPINKINVRGEQGEQGKDGASAFDVWEKLHKEEGKKVTEEDFFDDIASRVKTQDGTTWIPEITPDGQLYFKNSKTNEATNPRPVRGSDGKTFKPLFDGTKLYFVNENGEDTSPRIELKGEPGKTFTPKWDGNNLKFVAENGETVVINASDLKGKDAFELWKEHHHKPDAKFEEYEEYFKGQNIKSDHSYLDIKDFNCPVQTIDTDLIANVINSKKAPDKLIEDRLKDIEDKREKGKFNKAGLFKEFTWWCAGADRPLLRMCPGDHSKYTGIGTVILFTALMAWFSSSIALNLVFKPEEGDEYSTMAIVCGFIWALMIFFLDRFITNTMYSDGKVTISKEELVSGLPRIIIAIFLGIVISAPLELKIFEQEVMEQVRKTRKEYIETEQNNKTETLKADIDTLGIQIQERRDNATKVNNLTTQLDLAIKGRNSERNKYVPQPQKKYSENQSQKQQDDTKRANDQIAEENKKQLNSRTEKFDTTITRLESEIAGLKTDTFFLSQTRNDKKRELDTVYVYYKKMLSPDSLNVFAKKSGLFAQLDALHSIAMKKYEPWWPQKDKKENVIKDEQGKAQSKLASLEAILHSWWWFLFNSPIGLIMLLFILIDISPVLYKMMLADGVYDNYLQQEKFLAQDKIRLSLARMLRNIEKGELRTLSPFIMGKIYRKLMKFSTNKDGKYEGKEKDYKQHIVWEDPQNEINDQISTANKDVFEKVLDYKKRIILASYAAWYRDMQDAMIGAKDDPEGEKINPKNHFKDDIFKGNDENKEENLKTDKVNTDEESEFSTINTQKEDKETGEKESSENKASSNTSNSEETNQPTPPNEEDDSEFEHYIK